MFTDTCMAIVPALDDELFVVRNLKADELATAISEDEFYYDVARCAYTLAVRGMSENHLMDTTRDVYAILSGLKEKARRRALLATMHHCIDVLRSADVDTDSAERTCVRMVLKACDLF